MMIIEREAFWCFLAMSFLCGIGVGLVLHAFGIF